MYRSRYYFAWSNGWASLAFAGFDFLKWDEKSGKAVWGRACNSRPLKVEFCDSGRKLAAHWNISTGVFLRRWGAGTEKLGIGGGEGVMACVP